MHLGLGILYGELHVFIEEREDPEKTSEGEEESEKASYGSLSGAKVAKNFLKFFRFKAGYFNNI